MKLLLAVLLLAALPLASSNNDVNEKVEESNRNYVIATRLVSEQVVNSTLTNDVNDALPAAAYYRFDVGPNADQLSVVVRSEVASSEGGTLAVFLRRDALFQIGSASFEELASRCNGSLSSSSSSSSSSLSNKNNENTPVPSLPDSLDRYRCQYATLSEASMRPSAVRIDVPLPREGRYFLSFGVAQGASVDFVASAHWSECAGQSAGVPCVGVEPVHGAQPVEASVAAGQSNGYFVEVPDADDVLALRIALSRSSCSMLHAERDNGVVLVRQGNVPLSPVFDARILCASAPYEAAWIAPDAGTYFLMAVAGGGDRGAFNYTLDVEPVLASSLCKKGVSGVECNRTLADGVLCAPDALRTCTSPLDAGARADGSTHSHSIGLDEWRYYGVTLDADQYALDVSATVDSGADVSAEWLLVAHRGAIPTLQWPADDVDLSLTERTYAYTASGRATPDNDNVALSLSIPYPRAGRYYVAVYRRRRAVSFGGSPPPPTASFSLTMTKSACPDKCSSHGTCDSATNACACHSSRAGVACQVDVDDPSGKRRSDDDGLAIGLGVTIPLLTLLAITIIGFIIWRHRHFDTY
jgi:hypothetical protein